MRVRVGLRLGLGRECLERIALEAAAARQRARLVRLRFRLRVRVGVG